MEIEKRYSSIVRAWIWCKKDDPSYWHREDGPAFIFDDGTEEWWYYNKRYYFPREMSFNLFLAYCKWEYKKNGN